MFMGHSPAVTLRLQEHPAQHNIPLSSDLVLALGLSPANAIPRSCVDTPTARGYSRDECGRVRSSIVCSSGGLLSSLLPSWLAVHSIGGTRAETIRIGARSSFTTITLHIDSLTRPRNPLSLSITATSATRYEHFIPRSAPLPRAPRSRPNQGVFSRAGLLLLAARSTLRLPLAPLPAIPCNPFS
jgi:hypothetical protein